MSPCEQQPQQAQTASNTYINTCSYGSLQICQLQTTGDGQLWEETLGSSACHALQGKK